MPEADAAALVAEVDPTKLEGASLDTVADAVLRAVGQTIGITLATVTLIAPRTIPKTSSGKIRRRATRQALASGTLPVLHAFTQPRPKAARSFEARLGPASNPRNLLSWASALAADVERADPGPVLAKLHRMGAYRLLVPEAFGGGLGTTASVFEALRAIARRDLSVAVSFANSLLSSMPVWIAGTPSQQKRMAARVLAGARLGLALTEREHGADLTAGSVHATPVEGGHALSGEKWLINHVREGQGLTVLARTSDDGGLRGHSLFVFEPAVADPTTWNALPRERTLGVRGIDLSGVRFDGCVVPESARIGGEGRGLEITLQTLQLSRVACGVLAQGATDTVLACAVRFARDRVLQGRTVWALPRTQAVLTDAWVDLLIGACTTAVATRVLHLLPRSGQLVSAITKALVPPMLMKAIEAGAEILGARHYLEGPEADYGIVAKMLVDARVIPVFDGSTAVNLHGLGALLGSIGLRWVRAQPAASTVFDLSTPLPTLALSRLRVLSAPTDPVVAALPPAVTQLRTEARGLDDALHARAVSAAHALAGLIPEILAARAALEGTEGRGRDAPALFDLAEAWCAVFAASACLNLWLHTPADQLRPEIRAGDWLVIALERLHERVRSRDQLTPRPATPHGLAETLAERVEAGAPLSTLTVHEDA